MLRARGEISGLVKTLFRCSMLYAVRKQRGCGGCNLVANGRSDAVATKEFKRARMCACTCRLSMFVGSPIRRGIAFPGRHFAKSVKSFGFPFLFQHARPLTHSTLSRINMAEKLVPITRYISKNTV